MISFKIQFEAQPVSFRGMVSTIRCHVARMVKGPDIEQMTQQLPTMLFPQIIELMVIMKMITIMSGTTVTLEGLVLRSNGIEPFNGGKLTLKKMCGQNGK